LRLTFLEENHGGAVNVFVQVWQLQKKMKQFPFHEISSVLVLCKFTRVLACVCDVFALTSNASGCKAYPSQLHPTFCQVTLKSHGKFANLVSWVSAHLMGFKLTTTAKVTNHRK